jgi:hypothetical protein
LFAVLREERIIPDLSPVRPSGAERKRPASSMAREERQSPEAAAAHEA